MRLRRSLALGMVLALPAFMPHERTSPVRWALIVGISDYTNFGSEIGGDLPGAAWDARRMRDVLVARWGYPADHIRLVLDGEATRARIEREVTQWLPSVVKEGDVVTVFFAGHGSQTWDTNGDEADGLDETLCPADVTKGDAAADINDDEIEAWLRKVPTRNLTVILDNCHSGTGTRAVTPFARPRSLARNVASDLPKPGNASAASGADRGAAVGAPTWIEIAAAQADEVAVDAEWPGENGAPSTFGGAFTTHLVRNLWRVSRRTSPAEIFRLTVEDMKRERFAQQPLFTAAAGGDAPFALFQETDAADAAALPVLSAGAVVELGGGAGAGVTVGSIYQAGSTMLRVSDVAADRARATIVSGAPPGAGASAKLVAQVYGASPLRVSVADLDASTQQALRSATSSLQGLVLTTKPQEFAHLLVRPAETGYLVLGMDGARRHLVPRSGSDAMPAVAALLQHELSAHALSALDNPGAEPLAFSFEGGTTSFRIGQEIAFVVRVPRAGYLTIVDLGTDGRVSVLYPSEQGTTQLVKAGQTIRLPAGSGTFFEAQAPAGRGIVRAFLTSRPLGLSWTDAAESQAAAVAAALRRAAGPSPVAGVDAVPLATWRTASIVYTIEAK